MLWLPYMGATASESDENDDASREVTTSSLLRTLD